MKVRLAKLKNLIADNVYIIAAMLAVDFIMAFVFYMLELWPFGNKAMLHSDLYFQYWPLFTELFDRLAEHKSLIYSWNTGLGGPFLGNFYNYLSSPFLVYILIAGRNHITEAISMMIVSKASLAAGTFTYYLKKSQGSNSFITAAFGVLYAQSTWFLTFFWNVMWLDALYLLPLVVLGIERLIKDKKPLLYILSLAFTLLTNYYMGYMVCIFSVIWFLAYYFSNYRLVSDTGEHIGTLGEKKSFLETLKSSLFINRGFTFAFSSFMAAGLVAFALLPVAYTLKSCSAVFVNKLNVTDGYFSFSDFFVNHLDSILQNDGHTPVSLPNVSCGMLTLILFPLIIFLPNIKLRQKVVNVVLLVCFYFSFSNPALNFFWHAFHLPNGLPYRFSFMYIFAVLSIASLVISNIKSVKTPVILAWSTVLLFVILLMSKGKNNVIITTIVSSVVFLVLFLSVVLLLKYKSNNFSISSLLIFCLVVIEIVFCNSGLFPNMVTTKEYSDNKSNILRNTTIEEYQFNEFERIGHTSRDSKFMDGALNNYSSVASFSSMTPYKFTMVQSELGQKNNKLNGFMYNWQTPVYNIMNSVKYVISDKDNNTPEETTYYEYLCGTDEIDLYRSNYYLPIAFNVKESVKDWNIKNNDPMATQNNWFKSASGEKNVLNSCKIEASAQFVSENNGVYIFDKNETESQNIVFSISAPKGKHCYLYVKTNDYVNMGFKGKEYDCNYPFVIDVGVNDAYDVIFSPLNCTAKNEEIEIIIKSFWLDEATFEKGYEYLSQSPLEITSFNETNIKGTVNAKEDGVMWTSIPYDKGWSVTVDGKAVETIAVQDAYLCFDMPAGEHNVELTYTQLGLKEGICISIVSLLLCTAYVVILKKKQK